MRGADGVPQQTTECETPNMAEDVEPTDPNYEAEKGRISLWLDADDLEWLSQHCCCPPDATQETKDRCARIRFRSAAALHKSGNKGELGD